MNKSFLITLLVCIACVSAVGQSGPTAQTINVPEDAFSFLSEVMAVKVEGPPGKTIKDVRAPLDTLRRRIPTFPDVQIFEYEPAGGDKTRRRLKTIPHRLEKDVAIADLEGGTTYLIYARIPELDDSYRILNVLLSPDTELGKQFLALPPDRSGKLCPLIQCVRGVQPAADLPRELGLRGEDPAELRDLTRGVPSDFAYGEDFCRGCPGRYRPDDIIPEFETDGVLVGALGCISITKTAAPSVQAGCLLTYFVTVSNCSAWKLSSVTVTDALPTTVSFERVSTSQGTSTHIAGTVEWTVGDILAHSKATMNIIVKMDCPPRFVSRWSKAYPPIITNRAIVQGYVRTPRLQRLVKETKLETPLSTVEWIGVPADTTTACDALLTPPIVWMRNCDLIVRAGLVETTTRGQRPTSCDYYNYTLTRTWRATDACARVHSKRQVISVRDTMPPVISIAGPNPMTIECGQKYVEAGATAFDVCSGNISDQITHSGNVDTSQPGIYTMTYNVEDYCQNAANPQTRTVTVLDRTPPVLSNCPPDKVLIEGESTEPTHTGFPTASDRCDGDVTPSHSDSDAPGQCPNLLVKTRTWTATDSAGNSSTCRQIITVRDGDPPQLTGVPPSATYECASEVPPPPQLTATDAGGHIIIPTFQESRSPGTCPLVITRTWTTSNHCGQTKIARQVVTVNDTTPPTLIGLPSDITIECGALPPEVNVTADDNCGGTIPVTYEATNSGECPRTIVRTWTATDLCGNSVSVSRNAFASDTEPPVLASCPPDVTVQCMSEVPAAVAPAATDLCDPNPVITLNETQSKPGSNCENLIIRKWIAVDRCLNQSICTQTVRVAMSPRASVDLQDLRVECIGDVPSISEPRAWGLYANSGNLAAAIRPFGAPMSVGSRFSIDMDNGPVSGGTVGFSLERSATGTAALEWMSGDQSYLLRDASGVVDTQVPLTTEGMKITFELLDDNGYELEITRFPDNQVFTFSGTLVGSGAIDQFRGFDHTAGEGRLHDLFFNSMSILGGPPAQDTATSTEYDDGWQSGDNGGSGFRPWQLHPVPSSDLSGHFIFSSTINGDRVDTNSDGDIDTSPATANDPCGGRLTMTATSSDNGGSGCRNSPLVITRVWTGTDLCNAEATGDQTITVEDITGPVIEVQGDNPVTVAAGSAYVDAGARAVDGCAGDVTPLIQVDNPVNTAVPGEYTVTYTVSDPCGNPATPKTRTVNVGEVALKLGCLNAQRLGHNLPSGANQAQKFQVIKDERCARFDVHLLQEVMAKANDLNATRGRINGVTPQGYTNFLSQGIGSGSYIEGQGFVLRTSLKDLNDELPPNWRGVISYPNPAPAPVGFSRPPCGILLPLGTTYVFLVSFHALPDPPDARREAGLMAQAYQHFLDFFNDERVRIIIGGDWNIAAPSSPGEAPFDALFAKGVDKILPDVPTSRAGNRLDHFAWHSFPRLTVQDPIRDPVPRNGQEDDVAWWHANISDHLGISCRLDPP